MRFEIKNIEHLCFICDKYYTRYTVIIIKELMKESILCATALYKNLFLLYQIVLHENFV